MGQPTNKTHTHTQKKQEYVQGVLEVLVDLHDGGLVTTAVTVVGSREDGHDIFIVTPIVALHH